MAMHLELTIKPLVQSRPMALQRDIHWELEPIGCHRRTPVQPAAYLASGEPLSTFSNTTKSRALVRGHNYPQVTP